MATGNAIPSDVVHGVYDFRMRSEMALDREVIAERGFDPRTFGL